MWDSPPLHLKVGDSTKTSCLTTAMLAAQPRSPASLGKGLALPSKHGSLHARTPPPHRSSAAPVQAAPRQGPPHQGSCPKPGRGDPAEGTRSELQRHLQRAASPAAGGVTGRCCAGRDKGPWSWLVMQRGVQACLFCLSPPPPRATARGRQRRQPLPGLCLLKLATVTPAGLRVDSEAGDLPGRGISRAVGSQAGVPATVFGLCFLLRNLPGVSEKGSPGKRPCQPHSLQQAPGAPTARRRWQEMVCEKPPPSWRMCGLC